MRTRKEHVATILACLLVIMMCRKCVWVQVGAICVLIRAACLLSSRRRSNIFRMHLIETDDLNENLVVQCRLMDKSVLFMIDTGYAGPPVVSASYLAISDPQHLDVKSRYKRIVQRLETSVTADQQHMAIDNFIGVSGCKTYTSGCTMRLMGIGSTHEQQADMFMCDMLQLETRDGGYAYPKLDGSAHADMFVSNPLPTSVHILTSDFLLHSGPVWMDVARGELQMNLSVDQVILKKAMCTMLPMVLSGGSFVVDMKVGGHSYRCTVDTGAPGPISIDAKAAEKIRRCVRRNASVQQTGVNGERICSEIITTDVRFCGTEYDAVPVFVNSMGVEHVDGYVGMSFLRAFNILITKDGIGFAKNGMGMRTGDEMVRSATQQGCDIKLKAC